MREKTKLSGADGSDRPPSRVDPRTARPVPVGPTGADRISRLSQPGPIHNKKKKKATLSFKMKHLTLVVVLGVVTALVGLLNSDVKVVGLRKKTDWTGDDVDPYAPEDDDYDSDGVDAYPSEARTIVVSRRALNVLPSASTQRCNLFQTKALVGPDKACKVIIDGGSCRNLASKELCTKLKLKYLPHPHPYYIQWLSDNGEMKESHAGGLMGHFGREKTLLMLADHFYWPKMRRDVDRYVKRCITCNKSKSKLKPHELCPFEVVYGFKPITPLDLLPLPIHERVNMEASKRADFVRKIHVKTKELIEKKGKSNAARMNKKRKEILFKPGDMVWVHFRKDRFPKLRRSKLLPRGAGPYKVLSKINDNAYSIDLPIDEFGVSNSFNVADLTPYDGEDLGASRSTPFEGGGGDEDIPTTQLPPSLQDEDVPAVKLKYEEGASITRGGEEQLDQKLDVKLAMKLDMKTSHGSAREEREACAREEDQVQAGSGLTGRHAGASGPRPGRPRATPDQPGVVRISRLSQPGPIQ
ncbi:hypothetical protein QYE76_037909 [Lolium multiflorum]|uniref:Integrase zinc-binding domain-containing protein n=1 Tax=Lolium multiflorum TaxID=4521 RepID=A0AAD8T6Z7_LOLMU|nr:hypothetical protein QYE76_037909 [Lolium multiflorum]